MKQSDLWTQADYYRNYVDVECNCVYEFEFELEFTSYRG